MAFMNKILLKKKTLQIPCYLFDNRGFVITCEALAAHLKYNNPMAKLNILYLIKSKIKDHIIDKFSGKTSFEQWFSSISTERFNQLVKNNQLGYYTNKLSTEFRKTKSSI